MKTRSICCENDARKTKDSVALDLNLPEKSEMPVPEMILKEKVGKDPVGGKIIHGDCREICGWLASNELKVDMVYIDPPFATGSKFGGKIWLRGQDASHQGLPVMHYDDRIHKEDYLKWMGENLRAIRTVMAESASIYIHLDWHICHYVKILMDEIFGAENFLNEIVWAYKSGGASKGSFAKKHDTIYLYAKNKRKHVFNPLKEKSYNRDFRPYRFNGIEEYQDESGWYTLVNMKDVWEINMVGRTSYERVDYATQKPEALIERAIKASTEREMLVADFFGGSGTVAAVAARMNRFFIHGDINQSSIQITRSRLKKQNHQFEILESEYFSDIENRFKNELITKMYQQNNDWIIEIERYQSEEIIEMVEKQNLKKEELIQLSENGLETIEWISVDCENSEGAWNSSKELYINKKGNIVDHGIELKVLWNGKLVSKEKPKRLRVRDIAGKEKMVIYKEDNTERMAQEFNL